MLHDYTSLLNALPTLGSEVLTKINDTLKVKFPGIFTFYNGFWTCVSITKIVIFSNFISFFAKICEVWKNWMSSIFHQIFYALCFDTFDICQFFGMFDTCQYFWHIWQVFNSRSCQLILGAGAMHTQKLKSITAKHLALASEGLNMVMLIAPHLKAKLSVLLTEKRHVLLLNDMVRLLQVNFLLVVDCRICRFILGKDSSGIRVNLFLHFIVAALS